VKHDGSQDATRFLTGFLRELGVNLDDPHLVGTPERVVRAFRNDFLAGYEMDPDEFLSVQFEAKYNEIILVRDIPFYSLCAHHLIPFYGVAHVGYIPDKTITGLSKLARVVEAYSRRLQIQERLATQVADKIQEKLNPKGVGVVMVAEHLCMSARGISKPGAKTTTSSLRGCFLDDSRTRAEFMALING